MSKTRLGVSAQRTGFLACVGGLALVAMACSAGGAPSQPTAAPAAAGAPASQAASTPRLKLAMITHQAPGDTFWDIVRKGADTAAAKDSHELERSTDRSLAAVGQQLEAEAHELGIGTPAGGA